MAVSVLLSLYMDTRNTAMLLGDIAAMRDEVRKAVPDLRMDNITWQSLWQFIEELESFRGAANGTVPKSMPRALPIPATSRIHAKENFHAARDQARTHNQSTAQQAQKPDGRSRTREASVDSVLGNDDSGTMEGLVVQKDPITQEQTLVAVPRTGAPSMQTAVSSQQAPITSMQPAPLNHSYIFQAATQLPIVRKVDFPATAHSDTLQRAQALQAKRQRLSKDKYQSKTS